MAQYSLLKEHEVVDMFPLKPGSLPTISVKHIIFIARPKLALMDLVADYIQSLRYGFSIFINIAPPYTAISLCTAYFKRRVDIVCLIGILQPKMLCY